MAEADRLRIRAMERLEQTRARELRGRSTLEGRPFPSQMLLQTGYPVPVPLELEIPDDSVAGLWRELRARRSPGGAPGFLVAVEHPALEARGIRELRGTRFMTNWRSRYPWVVLVTASGYPNVDVLSDSPAGAPLETTTPWAEPERAPVH
jgi:hypothetical protein